MAGITGHILMAALKREFGIRTMIERELLPILGRVAFRTDLAVTAIVRIIDQMAANTLFGGVLVVFIRVTELTVEIPMFSGQWIIGIQVMIEILFAPALLVMTFIALFAQFPTVGIVRLMAIETERGGLAVFLILFGMTKLAGQLLVAAPELEIGL